MTTITEPISILDLRNKWSLVNFLKSDGSSGSGPGTTNISLSDFRGASFTDGTYVPTGNSEISIDTHFKDKTFGGSNNSFTEPDFNFNDDFSGEADRLYPVSSESSSTRQTSSEHKFARLFHSNVNYWYPSILLCPQAGDPTIGTEDDATVLSLIHI